MKNDSLLYRYGPPLGSYNYHYYLTHPHRYFIELFDQTKWFIQRGSHGYADCDVWSIDWHLTSYMPKALRDLALQVHGTPIIDTGRPLDPNDPSDCDTLTIEEWKETIRYIAETFDVARQIEDYDIKDVEDMKRKMKRFHQGMAMFSEYFFNLWD
jgi:hypothetical protein